MTAKVGRPAKLETQLKALDKLTKGGELTEFDSKLAAKIDVILAKMTDAMERNIPKLQPHQIAYSYGILFDKRNVLRGKPTSTKVTHNLTLNIDGNELRKRLVKGRAKTKAIKAESMPVIEAEVLPDPQGLPDSKSEESNE